MSTPLSATQEPEFGKFQTAEWDEARGMWHIRDLTEEEIEEKFPPSNVVLTPEEQAAAYREERILELRFNLLTTDYVSLPDYDKDKPDILAKRAEWRAELRSLGG